MDAFANVYRYLSVLYLSVEVISASIINVWLTHPVSNNILESIHVNILCQRKSSSLFNLITSVLHFDPYEDYSLFWKTKCGVITSDESSWGICWNSIPEPGGPVERPFFDGFRPGDGLQMAYSQWHFTLTVTLYICDSYNFNVFPIWFNCICY